MAKKDNSIYSARVRVEPKIALKIKVEAAKQSIPMGEFIKNLLKK